MSLRNILSKIEELSQTETVSESSRVHHAPPGGYGRKFDTDEEGAEVVKAAPVVSRGRGRPRKGSDETGEVKDFNGHELAKIMGLAGLAGKPGKGTRSNRIKEDEEQIEEAEAVSTRSHRAGPGGYGRKFDTDEEGAEVEKKEAPVSRGRGRPRKGSDETGAVKNYDGSALSKIMGINAPKDIKALNKKLPSIKHKLKDWMEHVETDMLAEAATLATSSTGASPTMDAAGQTPQQVQQQKNNKQAELRKQQGNLEKNELAQLSDLAAKAGIPADKAKQFAVKNTAELKNMRQQSQPAAQAQVAEDYTGMNAAGAPPEQEMPKGMKKKLGKKTVKESIGSPSLAQIIHAYPHEIKKLLELGEMDDDLYSALFDYYFNAGEMPYGVAKARDGDPYQWIFQRLEQDIQDYELQEGLIGGTIGGIAGKLGGTAIGGPVGGAVGGAVGSELGSMIGDKLSGEEEIEEASLEHQLNSLANNIKFGNEDEGLTVNSTANDVTSHMAQDELDEELDMNEEKKWIQKAIKKPGSLHKQLGVPQDEKIPAGKLAAAAKKGGKLGKRARLAQTLEKMHESDEVMEGWASELDALLNEDAKAPAMPQAAAASTVAGSPDMDMIKQLLARAGVAAGGESAAKGFDGETSDGTGLPSITAKTPGAGSDPHKDVVAGADEVPIMAMPRGMAFSANVENPPAEIVAPIDSVEVIKDLATDSDSEADAEGAYSDGDGDAILAFIKKMTSGDATSSAAPTTTPGRSNDYADEKTEFTVGEGEGGGTGATPAQSPLTNNKPEEVKEMGTTAGAVAEDEAGNAEESDAEQAAGESELSEEAGCEECGKAQCECSMNESHTSLFSRLFKVFEASESKAEEDDKAEKAAKEVAKDIEYDEGHKGKDDDKAEKAGKKVAKDIEYDDEKDEKEKVSEGLANSADNTVTADPDYMINTISAGLNGKKRNQTTVPQAEVEEAPKKKPVTNVSESADTSYADELKALAGINYNFKGQKAVDAEDYAAQMRKLAGIK